MIRTRRASNDSIANPWVIASLTIQVGSIVASLRGFTALVLPVAFLMAICCLIGAGDWAMRGSPIGILLIVIGIGSPAFIIWYPHHLGHFVHDHMADYRAAVPIVLAVDAGHCKHTEKLLAETCELRDLLPRELRPLGQSISAEYKDGKPVVFFRLIPGRHTILVYAPGWPAELPSWSLYRYLGDSWYTTLPGTI